jgi:hypothetical protein
MGREDQKKHKIFIHVKPTAWHSHPALAASFFYFSQRMNYTYCQPMAQQDQIAKRPIPHEEGISAQRRRSNY